MSVKKRFFLSLILLGTIGCLIWGFSPQTMRIRVIVDSAQIKATPEIGGQTVTTLPLGTTQEDREKRGEWYKIETERMTGYIHELLVEEVSADEGLGEGTGGAERSQGTRIAEIDFKMEECRWIAPSSDQDKKEKIVEIFKEYSFYSLIDRLP